MTGPKGEKPRILIGKNGLDTAAFEGAGMVPVFVPSVDEMLSAHGEAELTPLPFSLCLMPLEEGAWLSLFRHLHSTSQDMRFLLLGRTAVLGGFEVDESRCIILPSTADLALCVQLSRHLLSDAAQTTAKTRPNPAPTEDRRDGSRLDTLYAIVERLHGASTFESGIAAALESMARFLGAVTASLMLLDHEKNLLVVEALGPNRHKIIGRTFRLAESRFACHAIAGGKPILVTDMRNDRLFGESNLEMRYRSRSVLSVPIMSKSGPMAVVNLGGDTSEVSFAERDRDLVVTLSRQIAIALEKDKLFDQLKTAVSGSIRALANAIEAKDPYTMGHSERVTHYALLTAKAMGITDGDMEVLKQASILHDIGKIGIPGGVLHKPGRLDDFEYKIIQRHPDIGITIVRQIGAMDQTLPIIESHHERVDGKGYPRGLGGEDIPIGARIVAVADSFDAMTSNRPYRRGLRVDAALEEIMRCAGGQFDKRVAEAFADNLLNHPLPTDNQQDFSMT